LDAEGNPVENLGIEYGDAPDKATAAANADAADASVASATPVVDLAKEANSASFVAYLLDNLKIDSAELARFNPHHSHSANNNNNASNALLTFTDTAGAKLGLQGALQPLPAGLVPCTIDDKTAEKTYHDWEIKRKLFQVSSSCEALTNAVRKTEQFVREKSVAALKVVQQQEQQQEEEKEEAANSAAVSPLRRMLGIISPRKQQRSAAALAANAGPGPVHFVFN
jgi:hypothetical protein